MGHVVEVTPCLPHLRRDVRRSGTKIEIRILTSVILLLTEKNDIWAIRTRVPAIGICEGDTA